MNLLEGKKTYVVAGLFLVATVLAAFGVAVPEYAWGIIAALGLASVRAAIQTVGQNTGWKTYVASAAVFVVSVLSAAGVAIPVEVLDMVYAVFGALGIVGVRDAINKL